MGYKIYGFCSIKSETLALNEIIEVLVYKFRKWKEAFESKGLKVSLGKT